VRVYHPPGEVRSDLKLMTLDAVAPTKYLSPALGEAYARKSKEEQLVFPMAVAKNRIALNTQLLLMDRLINKDSGRLEFDPYSYTLPDGMSLRQYFHRAHCGPPLYQALRKALRRRHLDYDNPAGIVGGLARHYETVCDMKGLLTDIGVPRWEVDGHHYLVHNQGAIITYIVHVASPTHALASVPRKVLSYVHTDEWNGHRTLRADLQNSFQGHVDHLFHHLQINVTDTVYDAGDRDKGAFGITVLTVEWFAVRPQSFAYSG
jgi:hypothetical protein